MAREYEKLPGQGLRRGGFLVVTATRSRLWLGGDHLLLVDSNGYQESYKRFAFRDIEAITLTRTRRRLILNVVFCIPLAIFAGLAAFIPSQATQIFFGSVALLFAILVLINSLRGPTCRCDLTTAVQTDELASLRRLSRANKVLARLRPLIHAAQNASTTTAPPDVAGLRE